MAYTSYENSVATPVPFTPLVVGLATKDENPPRNQVDMVETREYINALPMEVRVATRNGLVVTIPPSPGNFGHGLMIREEYVFSEPCKLDADSVHKGTTDSSRARSEAVARKLTDGWHMWALAPIVTRVHAQDFDLHGKTLYLKELDIVVSIERGRRLIHPYSEEGNYETIVRGAEECVVEVANSTASVVLSLVDNSRKLGPKFANICGDIYRVPVTQNYGHEEGLYVIRNGLSKGSMSASPPTVDWYALDKMSEGFQLFDSVQEAQVHGDVVKHQEAERARQLQEAKTAELELKAELRDRELAHQEKLQDWEIQKRAYEDNKLRLEEENRNRKAQQERLQSELDMKSAVRKDNYEERSFERKDTLEYLKFLPLALAAIMGLVLALKK